jgi:hypothetical protein
MGRGKVYLPRLRTACFISQCKAGQKMKEIDSRRTSSKLNANVVLCKCHSSKKTFGIRIEKRGADWVRTWAFKIDDEESKREGYDKQTARGTMMPADDYPGCPYCGGYEIAQCTCGKIFCPPPKKTPQNKFQQITCPWCGVQDAYTQVETIQVQGGGL